MTVPVRFIGGPLHDMTGQTLALEQVMLFFDRRQRLCHAYQRSDELEYTYDQAMSSAMTANYDVALERFGDASSPISWENTGETPTELDND